MTPVSEPRTVDTPSQTPSRKGLKGNGLGVTALILGIISLVLAFVPFADFGTWGIGLIGLVLGIVGLALKGRRKRIAAAGTIVSAVAIVLSIVMAIVYTSVIIDTASKAIDHENKIAQTPVTLTYNVTGTGSDVDITYESFQNGSASSSDVNGTKLPWTKTVTTKRGGAFDFTDFTLDVTNGDNTGKVVCSISIDGKVVSTRTASGSYASATCDTPSDLGK